MAQEPLDPLLESIFLTDDRRLDRRTFVALGSAGLMAATWLSPFAASAAGEEITLIAGSTPMSVGYILESDGISNLRRMNSNIRRPGLTDASAPANVTYNVVPADQLPIGDTSLIGQPLRIRLHGLYPPRLTANRYWSELPQRFELDLLYPNPDPAQREPLRYLAWTFERLSTSWRNSAPAALAFPLDWQSLPAFELRTFNGAKGRTFTTRFTLDTDEGLPRLRRGLYLLGLTPNAWATGMSLSELGTAMPRDRFSFLIAIEQDPTGRL